MDPREQVTADVGAAVVAERIGESIGPYRLRQVIGEGGFGVVYMAEQTHPISRRVALKVVKLGMDTRAVVARFEAERQALAMMDHPSIARVLDAGATASGRPYFVMELVKGEPITEYCDRNSLSIDERLDLFVQLCRAVQHAHTKGVIHRDLKPNNVLVSTQDGRPHAKVIDFGIAKATGGRLTEKTVFTEFRQLIGTPEYMSPEQAEGSLDVDTRTDVYSLGVMLYELLTGAKPFEATGLRSAPSDEIRRIIREEEPPRPSTRVTKSRAEMRVAAAHRRTEPARLGTLIKGDLDWIVMKCLEKDRSRRYETAEALAGDITRHRAGEAVVAAPPSAAYRVRKFVHRHSVAVVVAGVVAGAVLLGAGLAVAGYVSALKARDAEKVQTSRANEALERANKEAAKARAVNQFLQELLQGADPEQAKANRNVTVRELVDRSGAGLDAGRLKAQPELEAVVRVTIGQLYMALGDPKEARRHLTRALELGEAGALERDELAAARATLGHAFRDLDDVDAAETAYKRGLEDALAAGDRGMKERATLYNDLGGVALHRGKLDEAQALFEKAMAALDALPEPDPRARLQMKRNLAVLAAERGDMATAERLIREVSEEGASAFSEDDPLAAGAMRNLAVTIANQRRYKEAAPIAARAVESFRRINGDTHPETIDALQMLGNIAYANGDYVTAERAQREVLESRRAADANAPLADETRDSCNSIEGAAAPEAEPMRRRLLDVARAGGDAQAISTALANLGFNLIRQRRWVDAEPVLREVVEIRSGLYPEGHARYWSLVNCRSMLGEALLGRAEGSQAGAADLFREAEGFIVPAAEFFVADREMPYFAPGQVDLKGNGIERAVRLYTSWGAAEPEVGTKAQDWTARLAAYKETNRAEAEQAGR